MAVQSYAIYIRYPKTESNNKCKPGVNTTNNTAPNVDNPVTNPSSTSSSNIAGGSSTSGGGSNSFSMVGFIKSAKNPMSTLVGASAKALAPVAVGLATAKLIDSVVGAAIPYYVGYTGDVNASINYANIKSAISSIMNPISTIQSYATSQMELYQERLKIEQRRALTGNSLINNYGGKTSN